MDTLNQSSIANFSSPNSDEVLLGTFSEYNKSDLGLNVTDFHIELSPTGFPQVPTKALISYLICVNGIGVVSNLFVIESFLKKNASGLSSLLVQMATSDILLLTIVSVPEMLTNNFSSWVFGSEMCSVYLGFEVFAGTLAVYFLIILCFHSIASANLALRTGKRDGEEELLEDITEMKSSRHSLVSRSESSSPTKSADAGGNESPKIPVIIPAILVWILSASLSVPEFALSTTIDTRSGLSICAFADSDYLTSMRILLSIFQVLIPVVVFTVCGLLIMYKLRRIIATKEDCNDSMSVLRLSLFLCCLYLVLSAPRSILACTHLLLAGEEEDWNRFKTPPLNNSHAPPFVSFTLSFFHFFASTIKPFAFIYFVRNPKNKIFKKFMKYRKTNQEHEL